MERTQSKKRKVHNRPYKTFFASGDWTCSIARFTGTMKGATIGPGGKEIPPTGKSFEVDFCTVARWETERSSKRTCSTMSSG